ncbi:hypothetical protein C8R42DRAFT_348340 [Lentinula raphanica]|nr:hypothetical protein C8R42DRAFT_348340 [Lentinula raphanica]
MSIGFRIYRVQYALQSCCLQSCLQPKCDIVKVESSRVEPSISLRFLMVVLPISPGQGTSFLVVKCGVVLCKPVCDNCDPTPTDALLLKPTNAMDASSS